MLKHGLLTLHLPIFMILIARAIALVFVGTVGGTTFSWRARARKEDSLNRPDRLLCMLEKEAEKGLTANPKLKTEKERISQMLDDLGEKCQRGETTNSAYEKLKLEYEGKQKEIERKSKLH